MPNNVNDKVFKDIKPLFIKLLQQLDKKFKNASILIEKSNGHQYRVSTSGTTISENPSSAYGAVIRVQHERELYEYSFNDFSEAFLEQIPDLIPECYAHSPSNEKFTATLVNNEANILNFNKSTTYEINPMILDDQKITTLLSDLLSKALAYDSRIIDCICIYQYLTTHKMFLSADKDLEQHTMWSTGYIQPLASDGLKTHYYLQTFSKLGGAELLDEMNHDFSYGCKCAIELLSSIPPVPGIYDVICMPDITGLIAHEAFGHGVEMDMFVKDRALASQYMQKQVASPLVTMHDNAATINECATYFFDDEGTLSHDTVIIEHGILKSGINDLQSSQSLNVESTGNGRRESFERKVYARMTNTYFEPGNSSLQDMIASVTKGLLLENASNGMEDPKNWGIQCMATIGREIKNGKLTGKVFSPICLSGYVPDLLKSISMVSNELELCGCGYCGKGYKEWVKVSDGGPAIKARVKIS